MPRSSIAVGSASIIALICVAGRLAAADLDPRLGWWKASDGPILIEPDRIVFCDHSAYFCFYHIVEIGPDTIVVAANPGPSLAARRTFRLVGKELHLGFAGFVGGGSESIRKCSRLAKPGAAQTPPAIAIPAPAAVGDDEKAQMTAAILRLDKQGAEILATRPPSPAGGKLSDAEYEKAAKAKAAFAKRYAPFLTSTLAESRRMASRTGWIDAKRFGPESAAAAWRLLEALQANAAMLDTKEAEAYILVAAITESLRDVVDVAGCDPSAFARLDDASHLAIGRCQRFGTVIWDAAGWPHAVVPWLEDRKQVDAIRAKLSLPPLAKAMAAWSEGHKARPVELLDAMLAK